MFSTPLSEIISKGDGKFFMKSSMASHPDWALTCFTGNKVIYREKQSMITIIAVLPFLSLGSDVIV